MSLALGVLAAMGYGDSPDDVAQYVDRAGDGRVDGTIRQDGPGLDVAHVQAKRWENTAGRSADKTSARSLEA